MDLFYIIIIVIAVIILILMLTYIGLNMKKALKGSIAYPPIAGNCPDYWTVANDNISCKMPSAGSRNVGNIYGANSVIGNTIGYKSALGTIDFSDAKWTTGGKSNQCAKKMWANQYGVIWDGVSNFNGC